MTQQTARIDQMFSATLDAVDRAGGFVAEMVSKPIRQAQAMLAGVKAVIETLAQADAKPAPPSEGRSTPPAYGPEL